MPRRLLLILATLLVAMLVSLAPGAARPVAAQGDCSVDFARLDVMFVIDHTASMNSYIRSAIDESERIARGVQGLVPDVAFGVASFADYPIYATSDDVPYILHSNPVTDISFLRPNLERVFAARSGGGDIPESYARAIFEASQVVWREDARRVIVLMGDAIPHSRGDGFGDGLPDPGRDGVPGTADDLTFTGALATARDAGVRIAGLYFRSDSEVARHFNYAGSQTGGSARLFPSGGSITDELVGIVASVVCRSVEVSQTPAFVTAAVLPQPSISAARGQIVTVDVVMTNRGKGHAINAVLTLPFNPAVGQLLDAKFSRPTGWVSAVGTDNLTLQTGELRSGNDVITGTLRFLVNQGSADGAALLGRASMTWKDRSEGGRANANLPVVVSSGSSVHGTYPMIANPASGPAGSTHTFTSAVFSPREPVTLWYNLPDGSVRSLTTVTADKDGAISINLTTTGFAAGNYSMVAYGNFSTITAAVPFSVR
ncbi:VWA domain-containing protein [Candidatus Chloroploca sp. M-50]|uniref:VWA domain-containing protein n=1 Tax=Candidatus Chloroploca mongolica TaxID=2528176 RepID=A0ABS4DDZ4_9CHLR|nr:VWA domain-containing protein [Candidatus Chloroploca mongolica]MBP1467655.1 VWA domain-containing protein [Candidatus Chloroploca mongolica]